MTISAYTASVMLCRKLLMHVAVDQGAPTNQSFKQYVDYLEQNHYTPPGAHPWVNQIRELGNDANHEIVLMTQKDAEQLITFVEMLLKFLYEFPNRVPVP